MLDRANWVYAEGGYEISMYYAYTIENAFNDKDIANKKEKKLYEAIMIDKTGKLEKNKYFSGGYQNQTGKRFWILRDTPAKFDIDMQLTISSVISSKTSPKNDPTGGTNAWLGYRTGCHTGEYYIVSKGSRHFFKKYGESKKTCIEKKL